jgi:regulator of protease activity HflC (stomatin/prohibitin superfamily)
MPVRSLRRTILRLFEVVAIVGLAALVVLDVMRRVSSTGFLVEVADHQVALLVDNRDGSVRVDDTPGYHVLIPWVQDAYRLDKSPIEYVMTGDQWANYNHVPKLTVRAKDGATFWFDSVKVQYAIRPEDAWKVTRDAGAEYGWHQGTMDAFARSILRDEFGRHSAEEVVRAEVLRDATLRAKERLGNALAHRGLVVHEISTSKPLFPNEYESVVQRRKVAEREMETLTQQLEQLRASRTDRLAKLERDKSLAEELARDQLTKNLAKAQRDAERARAEADNAYEAKVRAGEQRRVELLSQADASVEKYTKEAEGFRARADALAAQGELAVLKKLIENLAKTEIVLEPFESLEDRARRTALK